jgi:hypothetical protein
LSTAQSRQLDAPLRKGRVVRKQPPDWGSKAASFQFLLIRFGNKAGAKFFCFKDPDGTFLELIKLYNG